MGWYRGAYRCVCVELRVHLLLLNAVMQSAELAELEGSCVTDSRHGRTLRLLRDFLSSLASDASNRYALFQRNIKTNTLGATPAHWHLKVSDPMCCIHGVYTNDFVSAEASVRSPWKLFIFII